MVAALNYDLGLRCAEHHHCYVLMIAEDVSEYRVGQDLMVLEAWN
jgi:hypothetical protein